MRGLKFILVLFFFGCLKFSMAQVYPVQLSAQLIPPYSGYLPDYADPSSEKLKIILQFNDLTTPQYNIRLKLEIKGNGFTLVTKQLFNPPPISLQSGVPLLLSGADLAPYLNSNNLDFVGINQNQYEQRMALPEGYYSVCVKAYDYYNPGNIQVSNESCSQAWFLLNDPPFLNLPQCGLSVTPQNPQNIIFQWTPMNMSSPNSVLNTDYEFALWEVRPDSSVNPNQVVLSTAPIFSTTTNQTIFNYGIAEPPLNLYMKYVWRVRAKDISGRDWFKNNGYGQICTFVYGNIQTVLGNAVNLTLNAEGVSHRLGKCTWNTQSIYTKYLLQVRKSGTQNWFDYNCTTGTEKVANLEPNTTYEARVRGEGSFVGDWSNIATFDTSSEPNYSCNDQTQYNDVLAAQPLPPQKAIIGLIIQTGQFEVVTTQIAPSGPPGWYSGKGYAKVFGLLPLAVQFNNIYIDDNNRHQQGVIQAMTQGINNWVNQWDVKGAEENSTYINGVDSVYVNGNQVCVKIQGKISDSCFAFPPNQNVVVIRDDQGNQWTVTVNPPPPTVTGPTNYYNFSNDELAAGDSALVVFEKSANQQYGFDEKKYTAWTNNYELIKLKNGNNYFVPYKSVAEFQSDEVYAKLDIKAFVASKLSFKSDNGTLLTSSAVNATSYKVTVSYQYKSVYAWYDGKKVGKLNVISLKAIAKKLVIVPVGNASANSGNLQTELNKVYKQANVTWSVTTKPAFAFNIGTDLEMADATLMSKYSTEMRALRDAYKQATPDYDKDAYYVFVVNGFSEPSTKGYMVRGRALGFVASSGSATENARVIAHELAHGAFGLEHTFPSIAKGSSQNLMDYSTGTELSKVQWEEMQNPGVVMNWLDLEEDASYYSNLLLNESSFLNYDFKGTNPYFDKAAELFADILRKSSCYNIKLNRQNQFFTTVTGTAFFFGNEIYIEHTFNSLTRFDNDIDFLMDWGLDFYDLQVDLNSNWKQRIYFYLARSEDKWRHSKQPPLLIDLLARVVTGIPSAVYGYASGKDLLDGHTLSSAEHALNLLEIVPIGMIGSKVMKGVRAIKVANKVLDLGASVFNKSKEEIKKLAQATLSSANNILTGLLKGIHNRLISGGVKYVIEGKIIKYLTKSGEELARIENDVFSVSKPKGAIPNPDKYLESSYIVAHSDKFKKEGAGFIVVKSWIEGGNPIYTALPSRKFVGLRSEMDVVINKYKSNGNDWTVLRDELNLGASTNLVNEEIYYVKIKGNDSRFSFEVPNGNEGGAIVGEWVPGGYTRNGTSEAALIGSETIVHNKSISQLLNYFPGMWEKIK